MLAKFTLVLNKGILLSLKQRPSLSVPPHFYYWSHTSCACRCETHAWTSWGSISFVVKWGKVLAWVRCSMPQNGKKYRPYHKPQNTKYNHNHNHTITNNMAWAQHVRQGLYLCHWPSTASSGANRLLFTLWATQGMLGLLFLPLGSCLGHLKVTHQK